MRIITEISDYQFQASSICFQQKMQEMHRGQGIACGPVPVMHANTQGTAKLSEAVGRMTGQQPPAQPQRIHDFSFVGIAQLAKFLPDKTIVKTGIVSGKHSAFRHLYQRPRHLVKFRGVRHHLVRDAGQTRNVIRDGPLRIDQRGIFFYNLFSICQKQSDLRNLLLPRTQSGGLYVYNRIHGNKIRRLKRTTKMSRKTSLQRHIILIPEGFYSVTIQQTRFFISSDKTIKKFLKTKFLYYTSPKTFFESFDLSSRRGVGGTPGQPVRRVSSLPERMNSFIQAGGRARPNGQSSGREPRGILLIKKRQANPQTCSKQADGQESNGSARV